MILQPRWLRKHVLEKTPYFQHGISFFSYSVPCSVSELVYTPTKSYDFDPVSPGSTGTPPKYLNCQPPDFRIANCMASETNDNYIYKD